MPNLKVAKWTDELANKAFALLQRYEESSLFLLSNIREVGPSMGAAFYSGNYKCVLKDEQVVAVLCLSKSGNLLLQTDRDADYSALIYQACGEETMAISGCIADWELASQFWAYYQSQHPNLITTKSSKDILYRRKLTDQDTRMYDNVRQLTLADFEQWEKLNSDYRQETGFPPQGTIEERHIVFKLKASQGHWWGLFHDKQLIAIAAFNASTDNVAQIGGVYTLPNYRGQSLASQVMSQIITDSYHKLGLSQLILFTEQDNDAAQRLYTKLGFEKIGWFGLIFGEIK